MLNKFYPFDLSRKRSTSFKVPFTLAFAVFVCLHFTKFPYENIQHSNELNDEHYRYITYIYVVTHIITGTKCILILDFTTSIILQV